jgi:membrane protease YdiL (CAAX protease family)
MADRHFALTWLAIWLSLWLGEPADQFRPVGGAGALPLIVLALVLAPTLEEVGWHGYGVDSLRARTGVLRATLLFGLLWSLWHAPLAFIEGTYQNQVASIDNPVFLANFFASVIPAAVIANWLYYKNDRSIVAAILLHAVVNAAAVLFSVGQVAKCIVTLLYVMVVAAVLVLDRPAFRAGPRDFVHDGHRR